MQQYLVLLEDWARKWGMKINPQKCNLQYFTKKRVSAPIIRICNEIINYKKTQRLLGLVLDSPRLKWVDHIKYLKSESIRRINFLKVFSSSVKGSSAKILRMFYVSYIRAKIDYGSIIYASAKSAELQKLEIIQNRAIRLILGARNTSPIVSLQTEVYLPPLDIHRGELILKRFVKMICTQSHTSLELDLRNLEDFTLDSFKCRALEWSTKIGFSARLTAISIPSLSESLPPWISLSQYIIKEATIQYMSTSIIFRDYVNDHYPNHILIYTDGSKLETETEKSVACASYNENTKRVICWKIHGEHSVMSAELYAIYKALMTISDYTRSYVVFTDSLSALYALENSKPKYYKNILGNVREKLHYLNQRTEVILHWIKGHNGLRGNEIADRAANIGHQNNKSELYSLDLSEYFSIINRKMLDYWKTDRRSTVDLTCKGLHLYNIDNRLCYNKYTLHLQNRRQQTLLTRLRIGHVGLNQYLKRFCMSDTEFCENPSCLGFEIPETIHHYLLECPEYIDHRAQLETELNHKGINSLSVKVLLLGEERYLRKSRDIIKSLMKYIQATDRLKPYQRTQVTSL